VNGRRARLARTKAKIRADPPVICPSATGRRSVRAQDPRSDAGFRLDDHFQAGKQQRARRLAGDQSVDLESIQIPTDNAEIIAWVRTSLPASYDLPDEICLEVVPDEARGLTTNEVAVQFIRPLRAAVAHSLLEGGVLPTETNDVEHLIQVRKWTRLLRSMTRLHLRAVYGIPAL